MREFLIACAVLIANSMTAMADSRTVESADGTLNPEEMTLNYFANSYDYKVGKSTACVYGYWATKSGDHADAKKIFDKCVESGVDAAYAWESYMHQNGYAVPQDLEKAAEWDRLSAERGYKVGQFNYGLSLLRGFGVKQDVARGRALIDAAAAQGFEAAREVIESGYDPEVAVPDADEKRIW